MNLQDRWKFPESVIKNIRITWSRVPWTHRDRQIKSWARLYYVEIDTIYELLGESPKGDF
mgnify:CR=1 FL=1